MIGDHHGRTAGGTTLLVRAVDGILGTHRVNAHGAMSAHAAMINVALASDAGA
jgi:hypothetical protein